MLSYFPHAPATVALLFITSIISLYAMRDELFRDKLTLIPYDVKLDKSYWKWITNGFVHGGPTHLFVNMLTLWFFGPLCEYTLGTPWFIVLYMSGLLAGSLGTHLRHVGNSGYPGTLGASGAISGVVLGTIVTNPMLGISIPGLTLIHPSLSLPAWIAGVLFLSVTLILMLRKDDMKKMNHDAHFWGAVTGFVIAFFLQPEPVQHLVASLNILL
ncbi:MAG: rhomboid family intramembrane serine protease [Bacteroidia bacterium]|nr:rhomboid family intramembrane serine protease [Bacteroidia bacterium]